MRWLNPGPDRSCSVRSERGNSSRFSQATLILRDRLHWLRCRERIQFKLCLTVYKALHGMAPGYLSDLCITEDTNERRRTLWSELTSTMTLIQPRRTSSTKFRDRAFAVAAPVALNNLPDSIGTASNIDLFKRQLKTLLFQISFALLQAPLKCNIHGHLGLRRHINYPTSNRQQSVSLRREAVGLYQSMFQ